MIEKNENSPGMWASINRQIACQLIVLMKCIPFYSQSIQEKMDPKEVHVWQAFTDQLQAYVTQSGPDSDNSEPVTFF